MIEKLLQTTYQFTLTSLNPVSYSVSLGWGSYMSDCTSFILKAVFLRDFCMIPISAVCGESQQP